eukprot:COSAG01_NODE_9923_length_2301_cov_1.404632_3_plen_66_part_00
MGSTATAPRTSLAIGSTGNPLDTWAGKNGTYHRRYDGHYSIMLYAPCYMLAAKCDSWIMSDMQNK